jgi:hypothetical protein
MILRKLLAASAMVVMIGFAAPRAEAAVSHGSSSIYFNSSGVMVGQQVTWCESNISHGGDVHQPYHVLLEWDCKTRAPIGASPAFPGTVVAQATFPPGVNITQLCSQMEGFCEGTQGPDILSGNGWTFYPGSGYDSQGNPTYP